MNFSAGLATRARPPARLSRRFRGRRRRALGAPSDFVAAAAAAAQLARCQNERGRTFSVQLPSFDGNARARANVIYAPLVHGAEQARRGPPSGEAGAMTIISVQYLATGAGQSGGRWLAREPHAQPLLGRRPPRPHSSWAARARLRLASLQLARAHPPPPASELSAPIDWRRRQSPAGHQPPLLAPVTIGPASKRKWA